MMEQEITKKQAAIFGIGGVIAVLVAIIAIPVYIGAHIDYDSVIKTRQEYIGVRGYLMIGCTYDAAGSEQWVSVCDLEPGTKIVATHYTTTDAWIIKEVKKEE